MKTTSKVTTIFLVLLLGAFLAGVNMNSASADDLSTGQIAYWKFDEGNGLSAADSSGNGNTATLQGATWTTAGKSGAALTFNSDQNQYVAYPSLPLGTGNQMSVATWVTSSFNQDADMVYQGSTGEFALLTRLVNGQQVVSFAVKINENLPNGTWHIVNATAPQANVWHQIVGVWTQGNSIELFVDGVSAASIPIPDYSLYTPGSTYPPSIGSYASHYDFFNGTIDEVMIYNRTLTSSEVSSLYSTVFPLPEYNWGTIGAIVIPFVALATVIAYRLKTKLR